VFMFQLPSAEYYKDENLFDDSLSLETWNWDEDQSTIGHDTRGKWDFKWSCRKDKHALHMYQNMTTQSIVILSNYIIRHCYLLFLFNTHLHRKLNKWWNTYNCIDSYYAHIYMYTRPYTIAGEIYYSYKYVAKLSNESNVGFA
jgi:hypothetical protein